ncbi:hypothetical protein M1B34_22140 [Pseudomonas sp. MAFF 302030]|uniref:HTH rpiR-type domain-containing protein n=1 Tax=Pseudomonas morbosilactucae TaxID=2938197 RepID=A0A9X2C7N1_9PSED|nr:hypothetical protein [Pseudomonas morbosilactucae]MCK9800316.1 hypothetical protein [Pseudomonas morbosilactucae]
MPNATASGRAIASYMLANLYELPFQTAADIADKLGVSESSVGRFCRAIGYSHFKDLKKRPEKTTSAKARGWSAIGCRNSVSSRTRRPRVCPAASSWKSAP